MPRTGLPRGVMSRIETIVGPGWVDEECDKAQCVIGAALRVYEQNYLAALILGFSARILAPEQTERQRRALEMTELLRELQEEFMAKGRQQGLKQGLQQGRKEGKREVAERMFRKGASVSDVVELTGLSEEEAEEIRKKVN
jgi:flagellar biosynthesis/type III secretory pathway protein FliH